MKGFTLIELLTAISIMSIGIVGIYGLVPRVVFVTSENENRLIASQLAREGLEIVRSIRDSNWLESNFRNPNQLWNQNLTSCVNGCKADYNDYSLDSTNPEEPLRIDSNGFYNYDSGNLTRFKRKIIINTSQADQLEVEVQVIWDGKGSPFKAKEILYNWR